ncbi:13110_t:CDS:1, partial [Entrophospora sp. SA101]
EKRKSTDTTNITATKDMKKRKKESASATLPDLTSSEKSKENINKSN